MRQFDHFYLYNLKFLIKKQFKTLNKVWKIAVYGYFLYTLHMMERNQVTQASAKIFDNWKSVIYYKYNDKLSEINFDYHRESVKISEI